MDIFYLHYNRSLSDGTPVGWLVGSYSSLKNAEEAQARMKLRPGYRDYPGGFSISCYRLDEEYDDPTMFGLWQRHDTRPDVWLNQVVAAAVGAAGLLLPKRRIEMASANATGVWARADPQQVGTVVAQLVANGLEAVGENGCVKVTVEWAHLAEPQPRFHPQLPGAIPAGWYARLVVSDDGCGMDEDTKSRMFEPSFSTKGEGRGMGLAKVYGLAGANGWWLDVQSEPGEGTQVKVLFPYFAPKPGVRPPPNQDATE